MSLTLFVVIFVVVLAIFFDFINGFHDASNIVATMIASKSITPAKALIIAAVCEFIGPLRFGTAVAATIGKGIVDPSAIDVWVVSAALTGAIFWNLMTWWWGIPSSSSHALVGGIAGAVIIGFGIERLNMGGFIKIIIVLITSPMIGLAFGFLFQKLGLFLTRGMTPSVNKFFKGAQLFSSIGLALSHGANDAQKSMGIITMVLVSYGYLQTFSVPFWVVFCCALAIALGTVTGGWSIIKTVGTGIYRLRPIHAFSAQTASAFVIFSAAILGGPVSTTHVVSSSIMGVGSAERIKAVRWHKASEIVIAWFVTIPAAGITAALTFYLISILRSLF